MSSGEKNSSPVDMLIIGGGPAGLATSVGVARNQHTAIVFDSGEYRNEGVTHFHLLPTWDNKSPRSLEQQLDRILWTIVVPPAMWTPKSSRRSSLTMVSSKFKMAKAKAGLGKVCFWQRGLRISFQISKAIVIAEARACKKLIFHCLFCHGGSESSGVLAIDDVAKLPFAIHVSRSALSLTKRVTIYTNENPTLTTQLGPALGDKAPVTVDDRRIIRLESISTGIGLTVHFADETSKEEAFLAHKPVAQIRGLFADQLGLDRMLDGDIKISPPFGETSVSGCFAAGDNCSFLKTVPNAINTGANVSAESASHVQTKLYGQKSLGEMIQDMQKEVGK